MAKGVPYDDVEISIYDPLELDITKKKIGVYKNVMDVERKLGISTTSIIRAMGNKSQTYSKVLNKKVAIRLTKKVINIL